MKHSRSQLVKSLHRCAHLSCAPRYYGNTRLWEDSNWVSMVRTSPLPSGDSGKIDNAGCNEEFGVKMAKFTQR